jgi:hypothetical protein
LREVKTAAKACDKEKIIVQIMDDDVVINKPITQNREFK